MHLAPLEVAPRRSRRDLPCPTRSSMSKERPCPFDGSRSERVPSPDSRATRADDRALERVRATPAAAPVWPDRPTCRTRQRDAAQSRCPAPPIAAAPAPGHRLPPAGERTRSATRGDASRDRQTRRTPALGRPPERGHVERDVRSNAS